jgi:hypothetical protein
MAALNQWTRQEAMEENEVKQLERASPIAQVAVELGLKLSGNMAQCLHPQRHAPDEGATLFFNVAKNTFLCKTCPDVGGDVVDLVCQVKGCDRPQAIDWLAHRIAFDQETKHKYGRKGKKK